MFETQVQPVSFLGVQFSANWNKKPHSILIPIMFNHHGMFHQLCVVYMVVVTVLPELLFLGCSGRLSR